MVKKRIHVDSYCRNRPGMGASDAFKHNWGAGYEEERSTYNRYYRPKNEIERVMKTDLFDIHALNDSKLTRRENKRNILSMASMRNLRF
jgi:hypothetical protein